MIVDNREMTKKCQCLGEKAKKNHKKARLECEIVVPFIHFLFPSPSILILARFQWKINLEPYSFFCCLWETVIELLIAQLLFRFFFTLSLCETFVQTMFLGLHSNMFHSTTRYENTFHSRFLFFFFLSLEVPEAIGKWK